ncbi:MAG: hypothetical protein QOD61_1973 [Solirubrobacteraceae bacterium]|nr:hypothetical protein [Solirubrobacteraceae bacterium]
MRRLAVCLALMAAGSLPTAIGLAQDSAPPAPTGPLAQNVTADNSKAGTTVALSGLTAVRGQGANAGSPSNIAQATAHDCTTPCQAIAAALQIVLIPDGTTYQAPQNLAVAVNLRCTGCGSFAYAYQYVVGVARAVRLSTGARHQIDQLHHEADQDVRAGLDYPTLDAKLTDLAHRFRAVVDTDLTHQHATEHDKHSSKTLKQQPPA